LTTNTYNRKVQIVLFFTIATLFFISIASYTPFVTPYAQGLKLSPSAIGVALGATGMASLLTRFPVGVMSQLLKRKKVMMQIGLLLVFTWILVILFPGFNTLYLAKAMGGVTGATWVMYTAMFPSYFSEEDLPKSIGIIQLASSIGPLIAANVGGYFASLYGYEYAFVVAIAAAGLGLVLSLFLKEPQAAERAEAKEVLNIAKNQLTSKNAWIIGLFATVAMMTTYAGVDYLVPVLVGNMGGAAFELTMVTNFFRIFGMIAAPVCGYVFYKKLGLVKTIAISGVLTGIASIACPYSPNFMVLYFLQAMVGFFFNVNITALMALVIMGVSAKEKPARMGLYQSIYSIGFLIGPMTSGRLAETLPLTTNYLVMGAAIIVAGLLAKPLLPKGLIAKSKEESLS
jgi:Arabinose efflux permease